VLASCAFGTVDQRAKELHVDSWEGRDEEEEDGFSQSSDPLEASQKEKTGAVTCFSAIRVFADGKETIQDRVTPFSRNRKTTLRKSGLTSIQKSAGKPRPEQVGQRPLFRL
jgi:hypothetical protein